MGVDPRITDVIEEEAIFAMQGIEGTEVYSMAANMPGVLHMRRVLAEEGKDGEEMCDISAFSGRICRLIRLLQGRM